MVEQRGSLALLTAEIDSRHIERAESLGDLDDLGDVGLRPLRCRLGLAVGHAHIAAPRADRLDLCCRARSQCSPDSVRSWSKSAESPSSSPVTAPTAPVVVLASAWTRAISADTASA
jgi:hypothetical protein